MLDIKRMRFPLDIILGEFKQTTQKSYRNDRAVADVRRVS